MRSIYFAKHKEGLKAFAEEMPTTKRFDIIAGKGVLRVRWEFEVEDVSIEPELAGIIGMEVKHAPAAVRVLMWAGDLVYWVRMKAREFWYRLFGKPPVISEDEWDQNVVYDGKIAEGPGDGY